MIKKISTFIASDYDKTLFPLETNKFLATQLPEKLHQATERILSGVGGFLSQQRVFAAKPDYLLRRTVKLDPVAEWFVYFMVYKYRDKFKPHPLEHRQWFGYYFKSGIPVPGRESYQEFKTNYRELLQEYKYSLEFDVSQYFNSIYHHDLLTWFQRISNNIEDINAFGSYFREINAGRSLDCLPQGLYPCKMIGNSFLNFVDFNGQIRCAKYIRFMDDFVLFDDDASLLLEDFYLIQTLLGKYGLAVSQYKTVLPFNRKVSETNEKIDDTKIELLRIREILLKDYDAFNRDAEDEIQIDLQPEQRDFLLDLLNNESIEEEDAELVLVLMKDDWERVFDRVVEVVFEFPNLAKNAYNFFQHVEDRNTVAYVLLQEIKTGKNLSEFQLFWMAKMLEDFLFTTKYTGQLLYELFNHRSATQISKAKILEIQNSFYGLPELRMEFLRAGRSDWLAWCAARGSCSEPKTQRNHTLKYFRRSSELNSLITEAVTTA